MEKERDFMKRLLQSCSFWFGGAAVLLVLGREVVYTTSAGQHGFFPGIIGPYRRLFFLLGSPGNMDVLLSHISCKARPSPKSAGRCTGEASERSLERPGVKKTSCSFSRKRVC